MKDERGGTIGPEVGNAVVTATVGALGDLAAANGNIVIGATLKSAAPLIGYTAGIG